MNGPSNVAAAEALLADAAVMKTAGELPETVALVIGEAQVRATLAVALAFATPHMGRDNVGNWNEAAR